MHCLRNPHGRGRAAVRRRPLPARDRWPDSDPTLDRDSGGAPAPAMLWQRPTKHGDPDTVAGSEL